MSNQTLTIDVPEEIVAIIGSTASTASRARTSLVLDLLQEGAISQGQAAKALNLSLWDLLDLMREKGVKSGPESVEDVRQEIDDARRLLGRV